MVKNHALYKKIAIATLIIAPVAAEMAARQSPAPTEQEEAGATNAATPTPGETPNTDAPPAPPPVQPMAPIQQSANAPGGLMDTTPTLDPNVVVSQMAPQAALPQPDRSQSADMPAIAQQPSARAEAPMPSPPTSDAPWPPSADR